MSAITTHVLDTMTGLPGTGISVVLERKTHSSGWQVIAEGMTNDDGRANDLMAATDEFETGHYRLTFETGVYFASKNIECFFPQVIVSFVVRDVLKHHHVPLLLSPYSYSTYRGS